MNHSHLRRCASFAPWIATATLFAVTNPSWASPPSALCAALLASQQPGAETRTPEDAIAEGWVELITGGAPGAALSEDALAWQGQLKSASSRRWPSSIRSAPKSSAGLPTRKSSTSGSPTGIFRSRSSPGSSADQVHSEQVANPPPVQLADGTVVVGSHDNHVSFIDPAQMNE